MSYSMREDAELVQNEGSDLKDFSDSGSEQNIVDSDEELVLADLEADSNDSDNSIFISSLGSVQPVEEFFFLLCLDSYHFAVATEKGI